MRKGSRLVPNVYGVKGDICEIRIEGGHTAFIDAADMCLAKSRRWFVMPHGRTFYCRSNKRRGLGEGRGNIWLHREIVCAVDGLEVDHINGDGLDNRRSNLRLCTHTQNAMNRRKQLSSSSKFKGVTWRADRSRWAASIRADGKSIHLGYFRAEMDAAASYSKAADRFFGEYARREDM